MDSGTRFIREAADHRHTQSKTTGHHVFAYCSPSVLIAGNTRYSRNRECSQANETWIVRRYALAGEILLLGPPPLAERLLKPLDGLSLPRRVSEKRRPVPSWPLRVR